MVRRMDRQGEVLILCRKMLGIRTTENGTRTDDCCKPEQVGTKEHGKVLKRIQILEGIGRMKDKRGQEKNTEDCGRSSKRED